MAFGILEDHQTPMPHGTVVLDDVFGKPDPDSILGRGSHVDPDDPNFSQLKKDGHIVLQPQPSDSPNDPLNWSPRHKWSFLCLLVITMVTMGGTHSMLTTGYRILADEYNTTFQEVVKHFTPPAVASHAVSLFFSSAIAAVYGKRVCYVLAVICIWGIMLAGYFANSLSYYSAINSIQGVAQAPLDLLLAPIITDTIYIHQRGRLMALSSVVHVIGGDASHVIAGNIITKLGIKYCYIISFAILSPLAVLIYLFVWETTYTGKRPHPKFGWNGPPESMASTDSSPPGSPTGKEKGQISHIERVETDGISPERRTIFEERLAQQNERKLTFREQLPVFRGRVTDRTLVASFLQPFPLMVFPSVMFSTVVNGAFITWLVISSLISFQVLAYPPYNLKPDTLAYIGLPGSIVSLISSVSAGLLNDWVIKKLAKANNGIYEPEFRLLAMIPATIFTTIGFAMLGPAYAEKYSVIKVVALQLFFHLGAPFAFSACLTYIFDTQGATSQEAFVATSLFKSIFIFIATSYVPNWFAKMGPRYVFKMLAILNLSFSLLTVPMYIYGKRLRGMIDRNKKLMKLSRVGKEY